MKAIFTTSAGWMETGTWGMGDAQRRAQKEDEHHAEKEDQPPVLDQQLHIHHGQQHISRQPDQHGRALHAHIADHAGHAHIVRGAGDQHHAEQRRTAAKPQQDQIRLLKKVRQHPSKTVEHGLSYPKKSHDLQVISIPQAAPCVNR